MGLGFGWAIRAHYRRLYEEFLLAVGVGGLGAAALFGWLGWLGVL